MLEALHGWLVTHGFPAETDLQPMKSGMGGTELWRVQPDGAPLVARVFPPGSDAAAEREATAMRAAAEGSVPVPAVVLQGCVGERPVVLTALAPGAAVRDLLGEHPERAEATGRAMGEALGRLHRLLAPPLPAREGGWIDRGGVSLAPLQERLEDVPMQDRLLHLDYHPANVLADGERITAIIDWENTMAGPPHMDLARTRALLWAIRRGWLARGPQLAALDDLETGLGRGHAAIIGDDPHPALSAAWGMAMTTDDLAQHLGKPGSWLTVELIGILRDERDRRILAAMDSH